ncbi:MAG TPA: alpha/beta fold hydrolase [Candidatus Limnocylindrales bacterium]|nr:alpha/beta fold hydrolase [Candidatus Limnocylindrales bacterium]
MYAQLNGISHYVEDSGGRGTPIVFMHGLGGSHESWSYQAPLADEFRIVTYDERGSGKTQKAAGPYSIELMADDLLALLDHLELQDPVLVGLSMGGGIAQTFELKYPGRARGLGLLSTSSEFSEGKRQVFRTRADTAERDGMSSLVDSMVVRWFSPAFTAEHPDVVGDVRGAQLAHDPRAFAARCRANSERGWTDRLGSISCPVLYVGGELDPGNFMSSVDTYKATVPTIDVHVIPGASHCIQIERPDLLNPLIANFVRGLARP